MSAIEITTAECLREYAQWMAESFYKLGHKPPKAWKYRNTFDFVARKGVAFPGTPPTEAELKELEPVLKIARRHCRFRLRECFMNAFILAETAEKLDCPLAYAEGIAHDMIPVTHAWNTWKGKVVDLTWRGDHSDQRTSLKSMLERIRHNAANHLYLGVDIPLKTVRRTMYSAKAYTSVIEDWTNDYPLLKEV